MAKVTAIDGGAVDTDEFIGEYMMVYFDEDGEVTPIWTDNLTEDQLSHGALKLLHYVQIANFVDLEDDDGSY